MTEPIKKLTEHFKVQPKDEILIEKKTKSNCETKNKIEIKNLSKNEKNKSPEIKVKLKDETKKIPEIKVQSIKSLKVPSDNERTKNRISRNVALNRSFNSNSKLELLR